MHPADHDVAYARNHRGDAVEAKGREHNDRALAAHDLGIDAGMLEFERTALISRSVCKLQRKAELSRCAVGTPHIDMPIVMIALAAFVAHQVGHVVVDETRQVEAPRAAVHLADHLLDLVERVAGTLIQRQALFGATPRLRHYGDEIVRVVPADAAGAPRLGVRRDHDARAFLGREYLLVADHGDLRIAHGHRR